MKVENPPKAAVPVVYIWKAAQTEPGLGGARYAATSAPESPKAIAPVSAGDGLVFSESLFTDWHLIGTAQGVCYTNEFGDFVQFATPKRWGQSFEVEEVVRLGWYTKLGEKG